MSYYINSEFGNMNLDKELIKKISKIKNEPSWMLEIRLKAFDSFSMHEEPDFGPKIKIDYDKIIFYKDNGEKLTDNWEDVQKNIYDEFENLGVVKAEQENLYAVANQLESEVFYHTKTEDNGIIFTSTDDALQKYPDLVKKYFNNLVNYNENKYTALNTALWSGGSFIYIPKNTQLDRPLQSYFRINTESLGQFERTIIIVDENSSLEYIEGCTAKSYTENSLHAGVVEIYIEKNSSCKYSTIQNWSKEVYNLVTKRAIVEENAKMEWVDGNLGSYITMKYPACILKGDNSIGNSISIAYAKENQHLDAGAKMIHLGKNTKSNIVSKSICENGGRSDYRGEVKILKNAKNSYASVKCDSIILDKFSKSYAFPKNITKNDNSYIEHEASVSKLSEEKLFYLRCSGLTENESKELLIAGFANEFKNALPMEYAVELSRLLKEL